MAAILTAVEVRARTARYMDLPSTDYPDTAIDGLVSEMDEVVCQYRHFAPTSRTTTEVVRVPGCSDTLVLSWPKVTAITSITVNGSALGASSYSFDGEAGIVRYTGTFQSTYPATVVYVNGYATAPETLKRATALYVASVFKSEDSGVSRDAISQNFDGVTTRYSTPDIAAGRPTGWLEVDRLLNLLPDYRTPGIA